MSKLHKLTASADEKRDDRSVAELEEEVRRLVAEGVASGFEPYEGMDKIKAEARKRLKQR